VGSWGAVWDLSDKDAAGNSVHGRVACVDTKSCLVASDKAFVGLLGVEDLVVVATGDAMLVARRSETANMKRLVDVLKKAAPNLPEQHMRVPRPWGSYEALELSERYQVKRIVVKPAGRLSLQKHLHRAEHWVVVRGTAEVTVGETCKLLHENESVFIPIGAV